MAELRAENLRLSNVIAQKPTDSLSNDQLLELLKLRGGIGQLRDAVHEVSQLRASNQEQLPGLAAQPAQPHPASPPPQIFQTYWPKSEIAFAGWASPVSALESALWAMSRGDSVAMEASLTPDAKAQLNNHERLSGEGTSAKRIADSLRLSSGFYITEQTQKSPDEVLLEVYFEGEGRTRSCTVKRTSDGWRFDRLGINVWP